MTATACAACGLPFDPTDTRFDGRARYGVTPWCGRCVDRCHEAMEFDHKCRVCHPPADTVADVDTGADEERYEAMATSGLLRPDDWDPED